jgi:hypothetical protein
VREVEIAHVAETVEEIAAATAVVAGVRAEVAVDAGAVAGGVPVAVGVEAGTGVLGVAAEAEDGIKLLCHITHGDSTKGRDESCGLSA